jgi:hypothetical protein
VILFHCPSCSQKYSVNDEFADKQITCRKCQTRLVVPSLTMAAPVAPPPIPAPESSKDCAFCGETVKINAFARGALTSRRVRPAPGHGGPPKVVAERVLV